MKTELIKRILDGNLTNEDKAELVLILINEEPEPSNLKQTYYTLYDQLHEKLSFQAKANYDEDYAITKPVPKTTYEAIHYGFDWELSNEGGDYWADISRELR
jgi:hypothetical protein